ncbi:MAG TPA: AraC family ligand binding domain-containing protein [Acidimicrobiales bacterium]|nr:AraC family ligand binding domain-containing protein [Acidimicrobiales bacterium]
MTDVGKRFVDISGTTPADPEAWEPVLFAASEIEAEIDRLAALPQPADGRRESLFVHPRATAPGLGLAPGIRVSLCVLRPGESTRPRRQNSTVVGFCLRGSGSAIVGGERIAVGQYDAWNIPSYRTSWHMNDGDDLHVRLEYSNAPVLEKLHVHLVDPQPPEEPPRRDGDAIDDDDPRRQSPYGTFELNDSGASLMPYERLINPPAVASHALHWPWQDVKKHLDELVALGHDYVGRRLYLLYNPMTGRTNGTTPSFFATITIRPPGIVDRPHRHVSAAINYFFEGSGWSRIAGQKYTWGAGDLMLTAPGWAIHHHASDDAPVYELTVQDQPFHIGLESLLWQEDLRHPPVVLGAQPGFWTNRV